MTPKAGVYSSEFWITTATALAAQVLTLLVATGKITPADQSALMTAVQTLLASLPAQAAAAAVVWKYIASRQALKAQALTQATAPQAVAPAK